jgi:hypothetical protein
LEIIVQQKRHIETVEEECSMLHQLVIGLTRSSHFVISHQRMSIGFVLEIAHEEESIHEAPGDVKPSPKEP